MKREMDSERHAVKYSAIAYVSIHCGPSGKYKSIEEARAALDSLSTPPTAIFSVADTRLLVFWQLTAEGTNPVKLLESIPPAVREKLEQTFGGPAFTVALAENISIPMFADSLLAQEGGGGLPS